ncbi:MAG: hypothetical protein QOD57_990 [Actinomycetota bacterium]|nr:hypothetical protein [Actinomycetota bacterium]
MPGRAASPPRSRSGTLTVGWRDTPGPLARSWRWSRGRPAVGWRHIIAVPPARKRVPGGAVAKDRRYRPATDPGGHRQPTVAPSGTPRRGTGAGAKGSRQYTVGPPAASRGHTVTPRPGRVATPSGLGRDTACDPGEELAGRLLDAAARRGAGCTEPAVGEWAPGARRTGVRLVVGRDRGRCATVSAPWSHRHRRGDVPW